MEISTLNSSNHMDQQLPQIENTPPRRNKSRTVLLGFALLVVAVFGVTVITNHTNHTTSPKNEVAVATVRITDHGFEPATLAVKVGTKVTWTSADHSLHQVVTNPFPVGGKPSNLKSAILNSDQTYTYVASTAGSFNYHDQMNPTVNGTLVVQKQ
jgi:plastocyanin